jgi:hypothetical protein
MKLALIQNTTHSDSDNQARMEYTLHLMWVTHHQERVDPILQFELKFAMMAEAKPTLFSPVYIQRTAVNQYGSK